MGFGNVQKLLDNMRKQIGPGMPLEPSFRSSFEPTLNEDQKAIDLEEATREAA